MGNVRQMNKAPGKYLTFCIFLVLALSTISIYFQVVNFDFILYDDPSYVYENQHVKDGFNAESFAWAFTTGAQSNWHPLTWLSHMLDCQLFGVNPGWHHLTNLILHIANTLLLFAVLKRMTNALWQSAFVAAAFALHPMHIESVAWISERKDVLSTLFWLLTMHAYLRYVKTPGKINYSLVMLVFALGLMTKPMLVTLPLVLLLLDYWPLKRFELVKADRPRFFLLALEKIPLICLAVASSVVTFLVQKAGGAVTDMNTIPLYMRLYNAVVSYGIYIWKMFFPARLALFYPHQGPGLGLWQVIITAILLITITVWAGRIAKTRPYVIIGWLWYLGTLVPVIGIVQVGGQSMADRYTYIPYIGLFIIIGWTLGDITAKWKQQKIVLAFLAITVFISISICSLLQIRHWKNSTALFSHSIDVTDDNYVAYCCLADVPRKAGKFDESIALNLKALELSPGYGYAHIGLGRAYNGLGRLGKTIEHFNEALKTFPDHSNIHGDLGVAYGKQDQLDKAVEHLTRAVEIDPDFAEAHSNLGYALMRQRKFDQAIPHLQKAIELNPNSISAHFRLAEIFSEKSETAEELKHLRKIIRVDPDSVKALNLMAWIFATDHDAKIRNSSEAVRFAKKACELTSYERPELVDTLAAAYAAAGDFNQAVTIQERVLQSARQEQYNDLIKEVEERLNLYKSGKPYIEPQSKTENSTN